MCGAVVPVVGQYRVERVERNKVMYPKVLATVTLADRIKARRRREDARDYTDISDSG